MKYIKPSVKALALDVQHFMETSLSTTDPTDLIDNPPGNGGTNDGSHTVGSKGGYDWDHTGENDLWR